MCLPAQSCLSMMLLKDVLQRLPSPGRLIAFIVTGDRLEVIVNGSEDIRRSSTWEPCVVLAHNLQTVSRQTTGRRHGTETRALALCLVSAEAKGILDLELTAPSPRAGQHVRPQAKSSLAFLVEIFLAHSTSEAKLGSGETVPVALRLSAVIGLVTTVVVKGEFHIARSARCRT